MRRVYLLRAYALGVGFVLLTLGLVGFTSLPHSTASESVLHLGIALLFFCGGLLLRDLGTLRTFLGGMGVLLLVGKGIIVSTRWFDEGFLHLPLVGIVCLVAGATSLLIALFVGGGASSED